MRQEAKTWWEQAKSDLKTAHHSFDAKDFDWSCFQAQQSVEKAFKALYLQEFAELRKVHDLVFLAQKLQVPSDYIPFCAWLNKVYVMARYPDASDIIPAKKFSREDAKKAIEVATTILQWLEKKL